MSATTQQLATINAAGQCWGYQHNGQQPVVTPTLDAWHVGTTAKVSPWTEQLAATAGIIAEALQLEDDDRASGRTVEPFAVYVDAACHAAGHVFTPGILATPRISNMIAVNLRTDWPQVTALAAHFSQMVIQSAGTDA